MIILTKPDFAFVRMVISIALRPLPHRNHEVFSLTGTLNVFTLTASALPTQSGPFKESD